MKTIEEIASHYDKLHQNYILFLMNARYGGDGLTMTKDDAEEMLSETILYHLSNPSKFNDKYVYVKLIQKRIDFYRDRGREKQMKEEFITEALTWKEEYEPYTEEEKAVLADEVDALKNKAHKDTINGYIGGRSLTTSAERVAVLRFKRKLEEKYSDSLDNGHRE